MGNAIAAKESGEIYQAMVFWKYAVRMLYNSDIEEVGYEYGEVKSFDDVVVFYKGEQCFRDSYINTDYIQVKFHMKQTKEFTMDDLLNPAFIDAKENSFLQKAVNAYRNAKEIFSQSRFILYTPWRIKQGDILNELINNVDKTFDLEKLQKGKTEKSKMGDLRQKLCKTLSLDEKELIEILKQICIRDGQEDMMKLEEVLNQNFTCKGLRQWTDHGHSYPYYNKVRSWSRAGINPITSDNIKIFCEKMKISNTDKKVVNIFVKSFKEYPKSIDIWKDDELDLTRYLEGRELKEGFTWTDVFTYARRYAYTELNPTTEYHMHIITPIPVAFMLGRIFNPKSGINIVFYQNTGDGLVNWDWDKADEQQYSLFEESDQEEICAGENDMAICIGVNQEISDAVREFIKSSQLKIGVFQRLSMRNPNIHSVENGTHAWQLAKQIDGVIKQRSGLSKKGKLHLFYAGPVALVFYLGMQSIMYGEIQFYEYDAKHKEYYPTIAFPQEGEL